MSSPHLEDSRSGGKKVPGESDDDLRRASTSSHEGGLETGLLLAISNEQVGNPEGERIRGP